MLGCSLDAKLAHPDILFVSGEILIAAQRVTHQNLSSKRQCYLVGAIIVHMRLLLLFGSTAHALHQGSRMRADSLPRTAHWICPSCVTVLFQPQWGLTLPP